MKVTCAASLLVLGACASGPSEPAALAVRASFLGEGIPSDVDELRVLTTIAEGSPSEQRVALDSLDRSGARPRLELDALPSETPIRIRIEARGSNTVRHVGNIGPLILGAGERFVQEVALQPFGASSLLMDERFAPRFLHAAVRLEDGRVLISGGFDVPEPRACPTGLPTASECYALKARDDAWLFDPTTARLYAVAGGMLEARAGHTATRLADGRVLIAGGAREAVLVLRGLGERSIPGLVPIDTEGVLSAHASFELFEPASPDEDPRDPSRGRIRGSLAAPDTSGPLERARFLHGAASNPIAPDQVLLAGGSAGSESASGFEVFDALRPGGPGSVRGSLGALSSARTQPAALGLREQDAGWVWLFGGNVAGSDAELAERWSATREDPAGTLERATESLYPNPRAADARPRPEYNLLRPLAVALDGGSHALVVGDVGPRCSDGTTVYPESSVSEEPLCAAEPRGYVMRAATGETAFAQGLREGHDFGAACALDAGRAVLSGGLVGPALSESAQLEVVALEGRGSAATIDVQGFDMIQARALHTLTSLLGEGVLSAGGLRMLGGSPALVEGLEVLWL